MQGQAAVAAAVAACCACAWHARQGLHELPPPALLLVPPDLTGWIFETDFSTDYTYLVKFGGNARYTLCTGEKGR